MNWGVKLPFSKKLLQISKKLLQMKNRLNKGSSK